MAGRTTTLYYLGNDADINAVSERVASKLRATGTVADDVNAKIATSSEVAGAKIGRAYDEGTTKAAAGLKRLSALGGTFGVPLTGSLDAVGKHLDETTVKTAKLHDTLAALGNVTLIGGLAGFGVAAAESVKMAESFQSATASIAANADISQKAADKIGNAFLGTAGHSIFSAQEMSAAFAAVSGQLKLTEGHALGAADATKVMAAASDLAEGTHEALGASTAALSTVMQAYHLSVGQAASASDMLFNVSRAMNVPLEAVAAGVNKLHGRLGVLAPTLTDTSALMIELGQHGITGTRGVTVVNTALQTLVGGSKNVTAVLRDLGVHIFDQNGKFIGLQAVISQLQPKLSGLTQQQQLFAEKTLFGSSAAQVMGQIVQAGVGKFQQATTAAQKMGTAHQAASDQAKTLHNQIETLKATVQDLATKFGLFLIPKLQATGTAIKDVIGWMGKHKTAAEALAGVITGVLGLAVTVFAYTKAKAFVGATADMIGGISKLASTIAVKTGLMAASTTAADATIGAENAAAGASFGALSAEATAGAAGVEGKTAAMAAAVGTADDAIVASNEAAGASFTALLGPIGLAAAAIYGITQIQTQNAPARYQNTTGLSPRLGSLGIGLPAGMTNPGAARGGTPLVGAQGIPPAIGGWSSGTIPVPSGGSNAQRIAGALAAQGFSKVAIAGILGNFAQETGGGNIANINTRDSGSGASGMGGMGLANWTGNRRIQEMDYANLHHESPTSLQAQIGYLIQELRGSYHGAYNAIAGAKTPQQAASLFNQIFEGGTDPGGIRERAAAQAYASLGASGGGGGAGTSNSGLASLMNGIANGTSGGSKPTMRYWNHKPVGKMTEAQWQAWLAQHPASTRSLLYGNPLPGMTSVGRTDQGVDYTATPGSAVNAIGAGRIVSIIQNWFKGQPLVEEQLTQGPDKGKFVYYAEQIARDKNGMPIGIHQGQQVRAGQRIGTVAASGTGLELGFGAPGGKTLAQATTGYTEGQVTPAGQAFLAFMKQIGSKGVYTTLNNQTGAVSGGGSNIGYTISQLEQAFTKALVNAGNSLLSKLGNAIESGTVKTLGNLLGVNTSTRIAEHTKFFGNSPLYHHGGNYTEPLGDVLGRAYSKLGPNASLAQINRAGGGLLAKGVAGSSQEKSFEQEVLRLYADGQKGLADRLVAAHKQAMQALGQELYAAQITKDAETLNLQATSLKDQTTAITDAAQGQLNVTKAQYQLVNDQGQAQLTAIRDMTQTVTDQLSGMVQSVQDHTQAMADSASAVVTGINDQTQIQVDVLGEKGLFGLNLVAQRLQVQLDQQKASDDRAIAVAQQNLDGVTATEHELVSNAQINLDQVTAAQDQVAALAQQRADTVGINQAVRLASAQARVDANLLHNDVAVVGPAQIAVDLGAILPKAQQDVLNAQLRKAQGAAGVSEGRAQQWFAGVQDSVNAITAGAQQQAQAAQTAASAQIAASQATLASVQGDANYQIALAQQGLAGVQGSAATLEAGLSGGVSVTRARASTQFSGGGQVINIYGVPVEDAGAIGNAASWALRTAAV